MAYQRWKTQASRKLQFIQYNESVDFHNIGDCQLASNTHHETHTLAFGQQASKNTIGVLSDCQFWTDLIPLSLG